MLARKAATVNPPDLVGNWLYGVAYRTAQEARSRVRRHYERQRSVSQMPELADRHDPASGADDLRQLIDRELNRLPEKYRVAVVLCELEGRSRKEVAELLRVPEGTLSSRLAHARKLLADRLSARGLTASAVAVAAALAGQVAQGASPRVDLADASVPATHLAEKVMAVMKLAKLKSIAVATLASTLALCVAIGSLSALGRGFDEPPDRSKSVVQANRPAVDGGSKETAKDPSPVEKLASFTAVHVKQGTVVIRQTNRDALSADEPRRDARVENGTLVLAGRDPSVEFAVEAREISKVTVEGGSVTLVDLKGKELTVDVIRPATVVLSGTVAEQTIRAASGSSVDAQACKAKKAIVTVAAGARVVVHAADNLNATVAAGGTVEYFGSPKVVDKVSLGGTLTARDGAPAPPRLEVPAAQPPHKESTNQPKPQTAAQPAALTLTAEVDGYTQATTFNKQKYPFKYVGTSTLDAEQLKALSKAGDVPDAVATAMLSCLLCPNQGDVLQKAALKSDGKNLTGDVAILHNYGKQGTHVLKFRLEATLDAGRLTCRVVNPTVSGTWDSGFPIVLGGEVKIAVSSR